MKKSEKQKEGGGRAFVRLKSLAEGGVPDSSPPAAPRMPMMVTPTPTIMAATRRSQGNETRTAVTEQLAAIDEQIGMIEENDEHLLKRGKTLDDLRTTRARYESQLARLDAAGQ